MVIEKRSNFPVRVPLQSLGRNMHPADLEAMGYREIRPLPNGELAALFPFIFTVGIVVGLDDFGYRCRWCYDNYAVASAALAAWDGTEDPPGPWIKKKGRTLEGEHVDLSQSDIAL